MKTTIRLDAYNESSYNGNDLSIVGIVCKESGFVLAGGMNRKMKADFVKSEDFFVWSEEEKTDRLATFHWHDDESGCDHLLIETSNSMPALIDNWSAFDYVLLVVGTGNSELATSLVKQLNTVETIQLVQLLHSATLETNTPVKETKSVQLNLLGEAVESKPAKAKNRSAKNDKKMSAKQLDNLLFDLEDYMSVLAKHKPTFDNPYI